MKLNISNIDKHALRATAIAAATVAALLLLGRCLNTDWLEAEKLVAEQIQFSDLFFSWHKHNNLPEGRNVYVLDISNFQNHKEQAVFFEQLAEAKPYMVALDIIYVQETDSAVDRHLVEAISKLPNLVLEKEYRLKTGYQRSFFADGSQLEALSNLSSFIIRDWKSFDIIDGDTIPTLAAVIAQKMGADIPKNNCGGLIDYSICDTNYLEIDKTTSFNWGMLENEVVIVGDLKDLRDTRNVPFAYHPSMRTSGVMVHKQIVQTIIAQNWIRPISAVWNWIIIFIILWIFVFTDSVIPTTIHQSKAIQNTLINLIKTFTLLLLIFIAYIVFWKAHYSINVWGAILAPIALWMGNILIEFAQACVIGVKRMIQLISKIKIKK